MVEISFKEKINTAKKLGLKNKRFPLSDRLTDLPMEAISKLGCFAILNQSISLEGISFFFKYCDFIISSTEEVEEWVLCCVEKGILQAETNTDMFFFFTDKEVNTYFEKVLSEVIKIEWHLASDRFYISWLTDVATTLKIDLPDNEEEQRSFFVGPNGLLDTLAHSPQFQSTFLSAIKVAVSWQEHLFQIKKYEEAAGIVNMICFALARQGERPYAESLLIRIISVTKGMSNLAAQINLATLFREEAKLKIALRLYRGTILGLLKNKAYQQLAIVFSEMGAIQRQNGYLFPAAITLEICSLLHGKIKNGKSQAIARSQLASVYRYAKLYGLSLRSSNMACNYFRANYDYLNLGRSLLTRGNTLYNLKSGDRALLCFEEALSIGQMISDPQSICGALSGRARVLMLMNNLTEVKPLLDEVISIRQRNSDHSVGIEYQNMGYYFELSRNLPMALVWFNKALKAFKQYIPVEVASCERNISKVEKQLRISNHI